MGLDLWRISSVCCPSRTLPGGGSRVSTPSSLCELWFGRVKTGWQESKNWPARQCGTAGQKINIRTIARSQINRRGICYPDVSINPYRKWFLNYSSNPCVYEIAIG